MKLGFELRKLVLPLNVLLPVRQIKERQREGPRYRTIVASIKELGLVETLVVYPQKEEPGKYLILDGHMRYSALKGLGRTEAECIIANDDECFTYNARVSRLNPIQEHKMVMKAVRSGVSPERIAGALNMEVRYVKASMTLLDGIHAEAADLLKEKNIAPKAIRLLRKVTGVRQIEIVELMVSANNFTRGYAEALVLGTHKDQLANPQEPKEKKGLTQEEIAKMEQEMESLEHGLKAVEESYGENMLNLTCARGYIKKLLENGKVVRFLNANDPDIFTEFEKIAATETM